jgi:prolyl oligopeptidase
VWGYGADSAAPPRRPHYPQSMYPDPLSYSPYHLVRAGAAYPALLLLAGGQDVWCPPWHSRKLAARMSDATSSENPILLRVWDEAGHDFPTADAEAVSEWLTFLFEELRMQFSERSPRPRRSRPSGSAQS